MSWPLLKNELQIAISNPVLPLVIWSVVFEYLDSKEGERRYLWVVRQFKSRYEQCDRKLHAVQRNSRCEICHHVIPIEQLVLTRTEMPGGHIVYKWQEPKKIRLRRWRLAAFDMQLLRQLL